MTTFRTLINIDANLLNLFNELERYFSITLDKEVVKKIFKDAEDDQVSEKEYVLLTSEKKLLRRQMTIKGKVDHYEPEDIWITVENINAKDVQHFNERYSR